MGLAVVADELETADHLADGEEAEALSEENTSSGDLCPGDVADVLEGSASLGEERAGLDGLDEVLKVGLEGGDGGRSHALAPEDNAAKLSSDLAVVDDEGGLALNEGNELAGAATDATEGAGEALGVFGKSRASGGADAGETFGGLGRELGGLSSSLLSGLGSLLGGGRLEADRAAAEGEGRAPGNEGE